MTGSAATPNQSHLEGASSAHKKSFPQAQGKLASEPAKKYVIVTCMDARLDPAAAFGIAVGDAHVIRNAGGAAHDALRSIVISQQFLGTTEVMVVKHTKCGMAKVTNEGVFTAVQKSLGTEGVSELRSRNLTDFMGFKVAETAVKDDVAFLAGSKAILLHTVVSGWIYDVETGETTRVV